MRRLGRYFGIAGVAMAAMLSIQAMAQTQMAGRDFNHVTTGFPLTGIHAAAACETCHIAGVFKGTARNCDGCHSLGKRVLATPKSANHIVTDAPCETCHFNASTFLGARFNHGTAQPGQCLSCHNGRQSMAKPASHSTGNKAINSCDQCHRSYTWLPASWNHIGVAPGTCTNCHNGSAAIGKPGDHTTIPKAQYQCDECHSMYGWIPGGYLHRTPGVCATCHNNVTAMGKGPSHLVTTAACDSCHKSTRTWLGATAHSGNEAGRCLECHIPDRPSGHNTAEYLVSCDACHKSMTSWASALGAKPGNHIPYNSGVSCGSCHTGTAKVNKNTLHAFSIASNTCETCHIGSSNPYDMGQETKRSHEGSSANNCTKSGCHFNAASYINWDE